MTHSVYEALLNSNAVIEFDIHGNVLWANSNYLNLIGYELQEIYRKNRSLFLPEFEEYKYKYQAMWAHLVEGHAQCGEYRLLTKNRQILWIQASYTPVRDIQGKVIKVVKMAMDITEKKSLAENLQKKNQELASAALKAKTATQAKSVFLANMSHEIRTPLNSIIGITDTLAETPLNEKQSTYIEILQKANIQLMTLINDILDLSKVENGEIELRPLPFHLPTLLKEIESILGFRAREKGLDLRIKIDENLAEHYIGDVHRIRQVLMNLLNNAIKFTHYGSVELKVSLNNTSHIGNLLFCVSDTGIGIAKRQAKEIFQPFTQVDATTTRKFGGTGLGLSIAKNIVNLMQGHIWFESIPDQGSSFFFTVSAAATTAADFNSHNPLQQNLNFSSQQEEPSLDPLNILVVDDVDDNRNLLGIYLQKTPHYLHYAESGAKALQLLSDKKFDVIFMDVQMPDMDGYETTRRIRDLESRLGYNPAKIFACTANAFNEDIQKSLEAGCDKHLCKPIRKDVVLKSIQEINWAATDEVTA